MHPGSAFFLGASSKGSTPADDDTFHEDSRNREGTQVIMAQGATSGGGNGLGMTEYATTGPRDTRDTTRYFVLGELPLLVRPLQYFESVWHGLDVYPVERYTKRMACGHKWKSTSIRTSTSGWN